LEESKRQLLVIDRLLLSITGGAAKANQSLSTMGKTVAGTTTKAVRNLSVIEAKMTSMISKSAAVTSAWKTGFAQGFQIAEGKVVRSVRGMAVAWKTFIRDLNSGQAKAKANMVNFASAMGRTVGIVSAGLSKLFSLATSAFLIFTIGAAVWEKYGDSLRGITPEMRAIINASKEFKDALDEVNERAAEGVVRMGEEFPSSLKKLQDNLKFTAGTFASINTAIINFRKVVVNQLGGLGLEDADRRLKKLKERAEELEKIKLGTLTQPTASKDPGFAARLTFTKAQREEYEKLTVEVGKAEAAFKGLADTITTELVSSLVVAKRTAVAAGFEQFGSLLIQEINKGIEKTKIQLSGDEKGSLLQSALLKDTKEFDKTMEGIRARLDDDVAFDKFAENITKAVQGFIKIGDEASRTIDKSLSSLADVENRIGNFVGGLDKARAATGPNKEIAAFILDINRELKALAKNQDSITKNQTLTTLLGKPEELTKVKALLGFAKDEQVSLNLLLAEAERRQIIILKATEARLLGVKRLKIEAIKLSIVKLDEAKTDADRLSRLEAILRSEKITAEITLANAKATLAEQEDKLTSLRDQQNTTAETLNIQIAERDVMAENVKSLKARRDILEEDMRVQREHLKIIKEVLASEIKLNKLSKDRINATLKLGGALDNILDLREKLYQNEKRSLSLTRSKHQVEINGLPIKKLY